MGAHDTLPPPQLATGSQVYVVTLGTFEVYVAGQPAVWRGGAAGARQLKNMLAYLMSRPEWPVPRDRLIEIAGGHRDGSPQHVVPGLRRLLQRWGMADALEQRDQMFRLRPAPSWTTDTNRLMALSQAAQKQIDMQNLEAAIELLDEARTLCRGAYIPTYDAAPEYSIAHRAQYWEAQQLRVLVQLAQACQQLDRPCYYDIGLSAVTDAFQIDPEHPKIAWLRDAIVRQFIGGAAEGFAASE
jgi:hypothetical protein